ncbi:two-component sensor histidine kinase [Virgisporangium aliadipatigenens]|uniref:histidine kinase n=1 Tax=Virgisporangium aliadipatigenens TaxID=741659 RepID=A0A8J4DUR5_9ACTN|nr:histidine kinase [Virgisporangium aliadipatigenens]GIJ50666.1 two-component sensor histidine kinase [Virgisporangium aliadipatigenens]
MRYLRDGLLAGLTFFGVLAGTALFGGRVSYEGAFPLAVLLGGLLFLRHRWPVWVLVGGAASILSYRSSSLTDVGWVWPATFLYVAAVLRGRLGWAIGIGLFSVAYALSWEQSAAGHPFPDAVAAVGVETLWLAAVLAGTNAYLNWRRWRVEVVAAQRTAERLRIAQEVHDVVAHTLAVVGVHLNVAADALDAAEPAEARDALRLAQRVRSRAMTDLGSLVGVLREEGVAPPAVGLDDLPEMVARVREAGLDATFVEEGDRSGVPAPVGLAVARVVQESLTNTVRHAGATSVRVLVTFDRKLVTVTVTDDGRGPGGERTGHGIIGMKERVSALGGTCTAGAGHPGFVVKAMIPT